MKAFLQWILGLLYPRNADAYIEGKASASPEDLDVHASVVDLLKSLGQDSSFAHRARISAQFGRPAYSGTSEQNQWLIREIKHRVALRSFP